MNFDLGMRRGDVIESGEEAKNGAGEDILCSFRAWCLDACKKSKLVHRCGCVHATDGRGRS